LLECEDDDTSQNAGGKAMGQNESDDQSDDDEPVDTEELNKSKTMKGSGGGLRIKLSLKPLRKSSRERKVRVNVC